MYSLYYVFCPILSFLFTLGLMPFLIRKLRVKGYKGRDMYKPNKPEIADFGGMGIFAGTIITISVLATFDTIFDVYLLIPLFVITAFFGFGLFDDLLGVSGKKFSGIRKAIMVLFPFPLALPVILLSPPEVYLPFDISFSLGLLLIIVAPLYVVVVANLVNIFSNFNGQSAGNVFLCFLFIIAKCLLVQKFETLPLTLILTGSVLGFLVFNWYPARVFPGNCGDYMMGAAVGVLIVVNGFYSFGFVMLIPMTLHFLLSVYWLNFKKDKYPHQKFGEVRKDGTLKVPHPYYLSWLFPYFFRLKEEQVTLITMVLTASFGILALAFF